MILTLADTLSTIIKSLGQMSRSGLSPFQMPLFNYRKTECVLYTEILFQILTLLDKTVAPI